MYVHTSSESRTCVLICYHVVSSPTRFAPTTPNPYLRYIRRRFDSLPRPFIYTCINI